MLRSDGFVSCQRPLRDNSPTAKFTSKLFLPKVEGRKGEGGLRTKGCSKQSLPDKPLITVVTAVFNGVQHLEGTIKSVISQTYDNFEYIIIDGGSTDGTLDIIKRYEGLIDYWVSEPDRGIYDAWNKAVITAQGEWLVFLGSGDTYNPSAILIYVNSILASEIIPNFISSRVHFVNSDKNVLRVWGTPFTWNGFRKAMTIAHVGAFNHRSLFERFGLFDTSYRSAGDYEFLMRCGQELRTLFINAVTAEVLVGGISMNNSTGLLEVRAIQKKYGMNPIIADYYYHLARIKQMMRPLIRGY